MKPGVYKNNSQETLKPHPIPRSQLYEQKHYDTDVTDQWIHSLKKQKQTHTYATFEEK